MQNSKFTPFIFFSEAQAIAFSEAARTLLTWAGTNYPATCFKLAREYIARIESPDNSACTANQDALERLRQDPVPKDLKHSGMIFPP